MAKILCSVIFFCFSFSLFAKDFYFLDNDKTCAVKTVKEGKLQNVDVSVIPHLPLYPKILPRHPGIVAFKVDDTVYLAPDHCFISTDKDDLKKEVERKPYVKKPPPSEVEKFRTQKYFFEVDLGTFSIGDKKAVSGDYNSVFPSQTTNPTTWGAAGPSNYKASSLLNFSFGIKKDSEKYLMFKLRVLNGQKKDTLELTDVNSGLSEEGTWTYSDTFYNFYVGYRWLYLIESKWKPSAGIYLGLSMMKTSLTDSDVTVEGSSIGPAVLGELGLEYLFNARYGVGAHFGYEYLGKRSIKFKNTDEAQNFKTDLSYNNTYFSLGLKVYF
jgi:hypothetical protein